MSILLIILIIGIVGLLSSMVIHKIIDKNEEILDNYYMSFKDYFNVIIDMVNRMTFILNKNVNDYTKDDKISVIIFKECNEESIPLDLFVSVGYIESLFQPEVVRYDEEINGKINAYVGLYQLSTIAFEDSVENLIKIDTNIKLAAKCLRHYFNLYKDWRIATMHYYCGNVIVEEGELYWNRVDKIRKEFNSNLKNKLKLAGIDVK